MKQILAMVLFALMIQGMTAANLIKDGDFSNLTGESLGREYFSNGGSLSLFTEEHTWNKCGKLGIDRFVKGKGDATRAQAEVWIGMDQQKRPGIPVKANGTYRYSIDLKGGRKGLKAFVGFCYWDGEDLWKNLKKGPRKTTKIIYLQPDWAVYKGTIAVPAGARRVALKVALWWNTDYGPMEYKIGDYLLFDNVTFTEATLGKDAPAAAASLLSAPHRKAMLGTWTTAAPVIDGDLRDAVWKDAETVSDFSLYKTGKEPVAGTEMKACVKGQDLYLGIRCEEPLTVRDGNLANGAALWNGDVVEIFFGPKKADRPLSQFVIGAGGGRYATRGGEELKHYDRWQAQVKRGEGQWTLECRIPLVELGWEKDVTIGEGIAFNVCRQRKAAKELITWSPVRHSFHEPKNFCLLVLGGYGAYLKRTYGVTAKVPGRLEFERQLQVAETARINERFKKHATRKFVVAPVSGTGDFSIPFESDSLFDPPETLALTAAVNEFKALPLAIYNLTDRAAEYRVTLETVVKYDGEFGLKGFPKNQIAIRQAVRTKETESESPSVRFDALPKMNQAFTILVPPQDVGIVWIDFDTTDVQPGSYEGRLRVMPQQEPAQWIKVTHYNDRKYQGAMQELPVRLDVRNIVLDKKSSVTFGFFQEAENADAFKLMREVGTENFGISPWHFDFGLDKEGNIDPRNRKGWGEKLHGMLERHQAWGKACGMSPTYFVGYSAYLTFQSLYGTQHDEVKNNRLWPQWLAAIRDFFQEHGIHEDSYAIETWDEPHPKRWSDIMKSHQLAKAAIPSTRLLLTLGNHLLSVAQLEALDPFTDEWILYRRRYFSRPEYLTFIAKSQKLGKKISHYTCDITLRSPLYHNYRLHAWFGEHHHLDGNYLFQFVDIRGTYGAPNWKVIPHGSLAYCSFGEYIPSLRFMALRQGVMDIKYLTKLKELGGTSPEVQAFLKSATQRVLVDHYHDTAEADKVREEMAQWIIKLQQKK